MPANVPEFGLEQVAHQSEINAAATILATLAFLKKRQIAGSDWVNFMGATFAASWQAIRAAGPPKALELIALDMVSIGAKIATFTVDAENSQGEAVFENWPDPTLLAAFDLSVPEAFEFMQIFAHLANYIGLGYSAELEPKENEVGVPDTTWLTESVRWQIKVKVWQE